MGGGLLVPVTRQLHLGAGDVPDLLSIGLSPGVFPRRCWILDLNEATPPDPARLTAYLADGDADDGRRYYRLMAPAFGGSLKFQVEDGTTVTLDEPALIASMQAYFAANPDYVGETANDTLCIIDEYVVDCIIQRAVFDGEEIYG